MSADDFTIHMPPHIRPEFVAWLAKRELRAGWRGFQRGHEQGYWGGHEQGYWEGRDEC